VVPHLSIGGAERQLLRLVEGLDKESFAPVVLSLCAGGAWADRFRGSGARVIELPRRRGIEWRRLAAVAAVVRRLAPAVVHTFLPAGNAYGRLAVVLTRAGRRRPVVIASERGVALRDPGFRGHLNRWLTRVTDVVLCNSEPLARVVRRRLPAAHVEVIENGVEDAGTRSRWSGARTDVLVVTVGRLVPEKDQATLLRACSVLLSRGIDFRLRVVGAGPLREELEELAETLRIGSMVEFTGARPDPARDLEEAQLFVLSSVVESFPNALTEAMAMAIPCITTDAGAARQIIEDGASGRVVPCGDPAALAAAMAELIASPLSRQRMGTAARSSVLSRFSLRRMVERTEQLYRACLGRTESTPVVMIPSGPARPASDEIGAVPRRSEPQRRIGMKDRR
jgi:glycosyltransferase involved in cell wall biosynthesis